ncbi:MAG: hypothetical protein ACREQ2_29415 [Candidatus Binatia bacterium]
MAGKVGTEKKGFHHEARPGKPQPKEILKNLTTKVAKSTKFVG